MKKPILWLALILVCGGLYGRYWQADSPVATPTPSPLAKSPGALSIVATATPKPPGPKAATPTETPQVPDPPEAPYGTPMNYAIPRSPLPASVLKNGWDDYYANWISEAHRRAERQAGRSSDYSSGYYYVAPLSKGKFYGAFEAVSGAKQHAWRLFYFQSGTWTPIGQGVQRNQAGWPTNSELVRMGAGEIPEPTWTQLRRCPRIPLIVVLE